MLNIFVIGPMGVDKDREEEKGAKISEHMAIIKAALETVLAEEHARLGPSRVHTPLDNSGSDITTWVFSEIDGVELGVVDITGRSPSVMYELAILHALGKSVIIFDRVEPAAAEPPFYLKHQNISRLSEFTRETVEAELRRRIADFRNVENPTSFKANPLSTFYDGVPLVDVSGALATAQGYRINFLKHVLDRAYGVIVESRKGKARIILENGGEELAPELNRLLIVRPSPALDMTADLEHIRNAAPGYRRLTIKREAEEARNVTLNVAGDMIVDLATTCYSYVHLPRFVRLKRETELLEIAIGQSLPARIVREEKMALDMMDLFFRKLEEEFGKDERISTSPGTKLYEVVEIDDLPDIFGG